MNYSTRKGYFFVNENKVSFEISSKWDVWTNDDNSKTYYEEDSVDFFFNGCKASFAKYVREDGVSYDYYYTGNTYLYNRLCRDGVLEYQHKEEIEYE